MKRYISGRTLRVAVCLLFWTCAWSVRAASGPTVTAMTPAPGAVLTAAPTSILVTLSAAVNPATVNGNSVQLKRAGPDGVFGTADDVVISPNSISVVNGNQIMLDLTGVSLVNDKYQVTLLGHSSSPPTAGLAAYWSFDEGTGTTAADSSGNGRNGTLAGPTWTTGVKGNALQFSATTNYVNISQSDIPVPWTFGLYVKRQNSTDVSSNILRSNASYVKLEQYPNVKKVGITLSGTGDYSFNYTAPINTWVHLTFVATPGSTALYVNGALQDTLNVTIPLPMLRIGDDTEAVIGTLDELRAYSRALSAAEIQALAGAASPVSDTNGNALDGEFAGTFPSGDGTPGGNFSAQFQLSLPVSDPSLIVQYPFDEGSGTVANDVSGHGNIGTLVGSPAYVADYTGQAGKYALQFAGTGQLVHTNSTFVNPQVFSLALRFKTTATSGGMLIGFGDSATGTSGNIDRFIYTSNNGQIYFGVYTGSDVAIASPNSYNDGLWHQVTVTLSNAGIQLYVDGNLVNSSAVNFAANFTGYWKLGTDNLGVFPGRPTTNSYTGAIDDVRIYNRALSAAEVLALNSLEMPNTVTAQSTSTSYSGAQYVTLSASVTATATVNEGTVTFQIMNGATPVGNAVASATVSNGSASVSYALPAGTSVGTYSISASYSGGATYASSSDNLHTLTINRVPLSVTANNTARAYGSANPAFTCTIVGIQNSDNITATYATSAGLTSIVGGYSIVPALVDPGNKLGNYTVTSNNGTLTVTAAPLSVTGANISRAYGAANPTLSGTITGIKNGENITATYATSATLLSVVGSYAIVPTLVDPNNKLSNYAVTSNNGTLTVTQAPLGAVAFNANRAYGAANATFSGILSGVLNGDNILATYDTAATPGSPVGNYSIMPSLLDPDSKLGNYSVSLSNGTLTVGKAALSVVADNLSRTYGAANPTLTGVISGVQNSDNISATYATSATAASVVGAYDILPTILDPGDKLGNYALSSTKGTLTVNPAALIVTPLDVSRVYGLPNPALSGDVSGVQNGDNITANFSTSATAASNAGSYSITATLNDPDSKLGNYTATLNKGTLTVNKSTPAIVWPAPAAIVAGNALDSTQLNASAQDANSSAALTGTFAYQPNIGALLAPGLAQTLSVTFTPGDTTNYSTATAQQTIDVAPAIAPAITSALSASTASNAAFAYTITADGSAPLTFSAAGLPAGLALNGADIGGNPTASGVFNVTLTATNYGGSDSKILKLIVIGSGTNHPPDIASAPTVSANPAVVGAALSFSAQATDADGDALDYNWDFGDGTVADGASVSKIFAAPGVYIVTVTVSDGQASATQSVDLVVNAQAAQDAFTIGKIKLGFSFVKSSNDNLSLSGQIPLPPGFFPAGKVVRILIGGFDTSVTLTNKGTSGDKSFSLRLKKGSTTASFSFAVKNRNLFAPLQELGFSKTASNPALNFPVIVVLDGTSHFASPTLVYTVKVNRLGPQSGTGKH